MPADRRFPVLITLAVLTLAAIACATSGTGEVTRLEDVVGEPGGAAIAPPPEQAEAEPTPPPPALPDAPDQPQDQPIPRAQTGYVIDDDFSDPTTGWPTGIHETASYGYEQGGYRIHVVVEDYFFWVPPEFDLDIADAIIDVDAIRPGGTDLEMGAAVMCRADPDTVSFYMFEVAFDGWYLISKYVNDEWVDIGEDWQPSDAINPDFNRIGVECLGNRLSLYVNNVPLRTIVDDELISGTIALSATSFEGKPDSDVLFDNLTVYVPEG